MFVTRRGRAVHYRKLSGVVALLGLALLAGCGKGKPEDGASGSTVTADQPDVQVDSGMPPREDFDPGSSPDTGYKITEDSSSDGPEAKLAADDGSVELPDSQADEGEQVQPATSDPVASAIDKETDIWKLARQLDMAEGKYSQAVIKRIVKLGKPPQSGLIDYYAPWCGPCRATKRRQT